MSNFPNAPNWARCRIVFDGTETFDARYAVGILNSVRDGWGNLTSHGLIGYKNLTHTLPACEIETGLEQNYSTAVNPVPQYTYTRSHAAHAGGTDADGWNYRLARTGMTQNGTVPSYDYYSGLISGLRVTLTVQIGIRFQVSGTYSISGVPSAYGIVPAWNATYENIADALKIQPHVDGVHIRGVQATLPRDANNIQMEWDFGLVSLVRQGVDPGYGQLNYVTTFTQTRGTTDYAPNSEIPSGTWLFESIFTPITVSDRPGCVTPRVSYGNGRAWGTIVPSLTNWIITGASGTNRVIDLDVGYNGGYTPPTGTYIASSQGNTSFRTVSGYTQAGGGSVYLTLAYSADNSPAGTWSGGSVVPHNNWYSRFEAYAWTSTPAWQIANESTLNGQSFRDLMGTLSTAYINYTVQSYSVRNRIGRNSTNPDYPLYGFGTPTQWSFTYDAIIELGECEVTGTFTNHTTTPVDGELPADGSWSSIGGYRRARTSIPADWTYISPNYHMDDDSLSFTVSQAGQCGYYIYSLTDQDWLVEDPYTINATYSVNIDVLPSEIVYGSGDYRTHNFIARIPNRFIDFEQGDEIELEFWTEVYNQPGEYAFTAKLIVDQAGY